MVAFFDLAKLILYIYRMSYIKDKVESFIPTKYNQFYWWRRFKMRETLHPYKPLYDKIINGDYDVSDYFYQAQYELELMEEKLSTIKNIEDTHEQRGLCMERYRRLNEDYAKDEAKIMESLRKDFKITFKVTNDELDNYMEQCDGDLMCLYNTVKQDYITKKPEKAHYV
jgi:hypothetical protein